MGRDAEALRNVTSANIACGYHAGDPGVMRRTVRAAHAAGVAIGAHPGLPDLVGFGRREMHVSPAEVEDLILYQVGALAAFAAAEGARLRHIKPHGALYNMAARDERLAAAISGSVAAFDRHLVLFCLAGSVQLAAGRAAGLRVASEGFADRAYEPDGSLTPRSRPGAVIHDPDLVVQRAVRMVTEGRVTATDGSEVALHVDTLCTHGDTPGAQALVQRLRAGLEGCGVAVMPVDRDGSAHA
jgi:UPF0271 protein